MAMTAVSKSGNAPAKSAQIVSAVLSRLYCYVNKNGNPTVSAIVNVATGEGIASHTIHLSLNGGAKPITEETLRFYGVTVEDFDSDIEVPVKIRLFEDGSEPELIGAPRASDSKVLKLIKL